MIVKNQNYDYSKLNGTILDSPRFEYAFFRTLFANDKNSTTHFIKAEMVDFDAMWNELKAFTDDKSYITHFIKAEMIDLSKLRCDLMGFVKLVALSYRDTVLKLKLDKADTLKLMELGPTYRHYIRGKIADEIKAYYKL